MRCDAIAMYTFADARIHEMGAWIASSSPTGLLDFRSAPSACLTMTSCLLPLPRPLASSNSIEEVRQSSLLVERSRPSESQYSSGGPHSVRQ